MTARNQFQHQVYPTTPKSPPVLKTLKCINPSGGAFANLHTTLGVGRVVVVHGTFMGDDPFGICEILKSLGQGVPMIAGQLDILARSIQENTRSMTTSVTQDVGNYTREFCDKFQQLVGDDPQVELLEPTWSSQNHHFARADLAIRLFHQLLSRPLMPDQRVLFWGHSHAGNAFALLTNLLANDRPSIARFFEAVGDQPDGHWKVVRQALLNAPSPHPLAARVVIATFGTPVRYGWDISGCAKLVHTSFHRPGNPGTPFATKPLFPPHAMNDVLGAVWGDWVQAFAIAGTDVSSPATMAVNEKLTALLEANLPDPQHQFDTLFIPSKRLRDTCARWKLGTRCHADGVNILVNYQPSGDTTPLGQAIETSLLGHGVATTIKWLPAHLEAVIEVLTASKV